MLGVAMPLLHGMRVAARAQRHDDLLQRGIAGALADAVDGAFHLAHAGPDGGERIGDRQAQIVVVVRGEDHLLGPRHPLAQHGEDAHHVLGQRIAHRIGDVDRGGAGAIAASTQRQRKSGSVRLPSSADHSTSSV